MQTNGSIAEDKATIRESMSRSLRALVIIWRSSPKWSVINAVFIVLLGFIPLVQLWAVKVLIDVTTEQVVAGRFVLSDAVGALVLMASTYVVSSVSSSVHDIVKERHSYRLSTYITEIIHDKAISVEYGFYEDATYHDMYYRAVAESVTRPQSVFYSVVGLLQGTLTVGSMAMLLASVHWLLPIVVVLIGLPIVFVKISFSRRYYKLQCDETDTERRMQYYNRVVTGKEFAKEVRMFGLGEHFKSLYRETRHQLRTKRNKLMMSDAMMESLVQLVVSVMFVVVFGVVMWLAVEQKMTVGFLAMYLMALQRSYGTAQMLLSRIASLYDSSLFLKHLFGYMDMQVKETTGERHFPKCIVSGISLKNVSFSYPNTERRVLEGVTFDIKAGETIAIVGRNGCGKSTLIKLLCGLYKPTSGRIEIDGIDMADIPRDEVAGNISAIFQDYMLYNASARDNIRFGGLRRLDGAECDIRQAAVDAGIDQVFSGLPKGYDTKLGNLFADGEMLSQGEWQRTALARSFYSKSQVIVMDEPTSSLDVFTEAMLVDNFHKITLGRTAIIVSHKMSSIKNADRIVVVDNHGIDDIGSYTELMGRNGLFRRMIDSGQV